MYYILKLLTTSATCIFNLSCDTVPRTCDDWMEVRGRWRHVVHVSLTSLHNSISYPVTLKSPEPSSTSSFQVVKLKCVAISVTAIMVGGVRSRGKSRVRPSSGSNLLYTSRTHFLYQQLNR